MPTQPQLGYGKPTEATIDQVNQWMRSQPWWSQIRGSNTGDLSESQRRQILRAAQANGVVVDEGDMEIDKGGNINPKGHKLRNTLIVAGIAAATIATMGAAGVFSGGAFGAGAQGLGGAGAAGLGPGATFATGSGIPTALAGGGAAGTAGATGGGAASLGLFGGASGIPYGAAGTAAGTSAGGASVLGTAGEIAGNGAWDAAGNFIGSSTVNNLAGGGVPWGRIFDVASEVGSRASDFAESRQAARQEEGLNAYRQNLANEARFRSQLEARRLALDAPQKRAANSLRGDRLAYAQDVHTELPSMFPKVTISGGFQPSMWSENTRQLGRQMSADALAGSGTDELTGPELERAPEPNMLDTALNYASLASTIPYRRNRRNAQRTGAPIYSPYDY